MGAGSLGAPTSGPEDEGGGSELAVSIEKREQQQEPADHTETWKTGIAGVTGPGPDSCGRLGLSPPLTSEEMGPRK